MELTIAAAMFAGIVSFLSPCVLPVVPAYLGQLGVVAASALPLTAGGALSTTAPTSRWHVLPHALAFVLGFGVAFTLLGLTLYAFRPLFDLPPVRIAGGLIVIVMGLNLMGVLRIGVLNRTFGPRRKFGEAPVGGLAARSPFAALALGAIFAVAHTPCVAPTLSAILGLSIQLGAAPQVILLLTGYSLGIGIPFLVLALAMDGSAKLTRPFLRHGRAVQLIGGGLVVLIGVLIVLDLLSVLSRAFISFWPQV